MTKVNKTRQPQNDPGLSHKDQMKLRMRLRAAREPVPFGVGTEIPNPKDPSGRALKVLWFRRRLKTGKYTPAVEDKKHEELRAATERS
jgi:hypothetical protein